MLTLCRLPCPPARDLIVWLVQSLETAYYSKLYLTRRMLFQQKHAWLKRFDLIIRDVVATPKEAVRGWLLCHFPTDSSELKHVSAKTKRRDKWILLDLCTFKKLALLRGVAQAWDLASTWKLKQVFSFYARQHVWAEWCNDEITRLFLSCLFFSDSIAFKLYILIVYDKNKSTEECPWS